MFDKSFPAYAFFFFKWRFISRTLISLSLGQDQSTVAQRAETTVTEYSLDTVSSKQRHTHSIS